MELTQIAEHLWTVSKRIDNAPREIEKRAKEKAKTEYEYRQALAREMITLKEKYPATLVSDIARGNVSELKYKRDLAEGLYKSAIESSKALQAELSALQSIYRHQNDM